MTKSTVTLEDFSVSGKDCIANPWCGVITVRASHAVLRDITATADDSIQAVFFVVSEVDSGYHHQITDIEFFRCRAIDPGTYGFLLSASEYLTIKDVVFTECEAINCGRYSRFNPWVTGFDFAERNNLENAEVIRCRAEGNWESGFHFEALPTKTSVRLVDCVSKDNAQKERTGAARIVFGAGYLVNGDMRLLNCTSENNDVGFYCTGGGFEIVNCTERASRTRYVLSCLNDSRGAHLTSSSATGELHPIVFGKGDMVGVTLGRLAISSENLSGETAGITVARDVWNAPEILIQDSHIQGYRYGIINTAAGAVRVKNVEVSGMR